MQTTQHETDSPPGMSEGRFVWLKDNVPWRNQFAKFDRTFELEELPQEFPLHLFADTRYRLQVNGEFVAAGPGRFVTQFPEFDTYELARLLRIGENLISVEVNFFGASSFQSMPDGRPGFIAWGGNEKTGLATPGAWRAFRLGAWRWDAPLFSFAQNPVEICDTRFSETGVPTPIVLLEGDDAPWGRLEPYSGAPIPYFVQYPKLIELAGRIESCEWRIGFMSHDPNNYQKVGREIPKPWTAFATWINSPREQFVTLSCFWSELLCNGHPVEIDTGTPHGNHGHCKLDLKGGWNLLTGKIQILSEYWAYCLGIPTASGISLHGCRDTACKEPFAVSPNVAYCKIHLPSPDDAGAPDDWLLHDGDSRLLTPARIMGWDSPAADSLRNIEFARLSEVSRIEAVEATWCFSFVGEFLGHLVLEVEAPEGALLDVAYDDWQTAQGGVALYQSNPFTDAADRFILRGGRQRVEVFHPRGGKLVEVTLRSPAGRVPLSLHGIFVRSRQTSGDDHTRFSSDSSILDWTWPVAMRTLIASTDEAFSDCPWRERGSYIGDGLVNIHLNLLLNRDYRSIRRTLRLFAQAQLPDGQLACCAPAWLRIPHEDFTLIWLLAVHDFCSLTGDPSLSEELWPTVQKIWASPTWERHTSGLWNAGKTRLFIDWGVISSERKGDANAAINIFRFAAGKACARMATVLGKNEEASAFNAEATGVETAMMKFLWNDTEGRFHPSLNENSAAVHANILALAFGLGDFETRSRILSYLEPKLRNNFAKGISGGPFSGYLELYFLHYALPALAEHGRPDLAEMIIDQHYGFLRTFDDDTLPECFCRVESSHGSRCHSWAGTPAIYAARYILGIRQAFPGNPRKLVFNPVVHGITRASGRIAHPDGWIDVSWSLKDGIIHPEISVPQLVEVEKMENTGRLHSTRSLPGEITGCSVVPSPRQSASP